MIDLTGPTHPVADCAYWGLDPDAINHHLDRIAWYRHRRDSTARRTDLHRARRIRHWADLAQIPLWIAIAAGAAIVLVRGRG